MKRLAIVAMVALALATAGCSSSKVIDGKEYKPYGLLNEDDRKDPSVKYEPCWVNIVWGAILVESIVGPIYFFGFDMFEPVGKK
jgi:hypothetical protein